MSGNTNSGTTAQQTIQDQEPFEATVPVDTLELVAETLTTTVDKAKINFTLSEIYAAASDAANVRLVGTGRHEIESNGVRTLAVTPGEILEQLHTFHPSVDEVTLRVNEGEDELFITDGTWTKSIELFDPDTVRQAVDIDEVLEVDYDVEAQADAWEFLGGLLKVAPIADDNLRVVPRDELSIEGKKATYDEESGEIHSSWPYRDTVDANIKTQSKDGEDAACLLSPDLVIDIAEALPLEGAVEVKFGDEKPLCLSSSKGPTAIVAPRTMPDTNSGE